MGPPLFAPIPAAAVLWELASFAQAWPGTSFHASQGAERVRAVSLCGRQEGPQGVWPCPACGLGSRTLARGAWPCRGPLLPAISDLWIPAEFSGLSLAVATESGLPPSPTPAPSPSLCFSAGACGRKEYWNQAWVHVLLGGEFSHLQGIVGLFWAR